MPKDPNEIGALWQKTSGNGDYMTGTVNGERIVVFQNTKRSSDNSPNWRILKARPKPDAPKPEPPAFDPKAAFGPASDTFEMD